MKTLKNKDDNKRIIKKNIIEKRKKNLEEILPTLIKNNSCLKTKRLENQSLKIKKE